MGGISDPSFRSSARAGISSRYPVRVEFPGPGGGGVAGAALALHCLPSSCREYCRRALRRAPPDCSAFSLSFDASVFVIESGRRRVAVEAALENRGENAYSTVLNISFSRNLQFASLIPKVRLRGEIRGFPEALLIPAG